jgi:hypothetical protein
MAGKTNTSATFFAQKKLLGKAHTSNLKTDGEELIGSNIQTATSLVFGEKIPLAPERTLYLLQSASNDDNATVEYIQFNLDVLTGTTYDANNTNPDGGAGSDTGEDSQVAGPHAYKFRLPSDYSSSTSNPRAGNGFFNDSALVHETLGIVQLVPPFFSQAAPNPYIVKIYQDDGGGGVGSEIPLLDNIDWNVDFYNGILFLQDYNASKIPAFARAFAYVGKMAEEVIASGSGGSGGGGGSGDAAAEYVLTTATGSLPNAKVIEAGTGITIVTGSNSITISSSTSAINGREKTTYFVTSSHTANSALNISGPDFSTVQYDTNKIDINLNGQLLHTGSSSQVIAGERDYYLSNTGSIVFGFDLETDDIVDTIISVVGGGSGGGGGETAASYLVLANTGSLSNERAISIGAGLTATDGGANGNYSIVNNNGNYVFNEYLGQGNGTNTLFTIDNTPTANKNISIFVNGLLQMPATDITSAPFQDYSVTGSNIYFTTASLPDAGTIIMANYTTNDAI